MRLETLRAGASGEPVVLKTTPWHDESSAVGGPYRERLKQVLAGFFEAGESTMQPKPELLADASNPVPEAVRLVDDAGTVVETYSCSDLMRDTGMKITSGDTPPER